MQKVGEVTDVSRGRVSTGLENERQKNSYYEQSTDNGGSTRKNLIDSLTLFFAEERFSATCDGAGKTMRFTVLHQYGNHEENTENNDYDLKCNHKNLLKRAKSTTHTNRNISSRSIITYNAKKSKDFLKKS